ncbi:unnamed protein product [Symbiodinium necroappetens]|uniref:Uncharacterized protein n=1 Tax=Symbiodinium necroappetens TaxID=1628268 RepID=A0A813AZU0_9DINO|nr:unnamed protein product [Symbiodinium necroappetens]
MLIDEQRYGVLNKILLDLSNVDKQLASRMGIPLESMWAGIKKLLIQDVRKTQESARANWEGGLFRELHEDLTKLSVAKRELAPHPDIVPNSIIEEARAKVEKNIKDVGLAALACLERHSSLASAMTQIFQFGSHLIRLAHIFTHLKDFKVQAETEVTHALNVCQDKHWGASFLIELGMKLSLGKVGDPKTDATVARIIASEFPHFESVRTAVFNRETRVTQRDVGETLKDICSVDVGTDGRRKDRPVPIKKLREGFEEYSAAFDTHLKDWIAGDLTPDQLAKTIIERAARLRSSRHGIWSPQSKSEFPQLLAAIFVLYAILKSGDAYERMDDAATRRSIRDVDNVESATLQAQVGLREFVAALCLPIWTFYSLYSHSRLLDLVRLRG